MGSRYQYDVNKVTRYIDIHKQFQGGLKTVDTDDALKDVYLREAQNISISEFNFIEKRYGLHQLGDPLKPWDSVENASSKLQGYFEYYVNANTIHKIIVFEGHFYIDQADGNDFQKVEFFTKPEGTVLFDLSSLGIYTEDVVNSIVTGTSFGTQVPRFAENHASLPTTSPFGGATSYVIYAFSNDTYYAWVPSTSSYVTVGTSPTDSYPGAGFVQGEFYHDTRTNTSYKWTATSGKTGIMVANQNIYKADIQTTRSVDGVRMEDKLYIATGTYPVYYKGDGKIYVFPQYEMSNYDINNLSYNLNSVDLEGQLSEKANPETSTHGNTLNGEAFPGSKVIQTKDFGYTPRLPFRGGDLTIDIAYHLYNTSGGDYWVNNLGLHDFNSTDTDPYGVLTAAAPWSVTGAHYEVKLTPRVYIKPTSGGVTEYVEIDQSRLTFTPLTNDQNVTTSSLRLPTNSAFSLSNYNVTIDDLDSGLYSLRIDLVITRTGYDMSGGPFGLKPIIDTVNFKINSIVIQELQIYEAEIDDYLVEPISTLRVHTCNRVIEHYGRLAMWGNPTNPTKLFFSTAGAKEYFPYFYSLDFSNDLQEGINAITKFQNILVVQSNSYTWGLKGTVPVLLDPLEGAQMEIITINPTIGCIAPQSVKNIRNQLFFLSKEGVFSLKSLFAEDYRYNVDPIDRNIYNIVPRHEDAISAYYDDQYWLHFPQTGETLRYYVEKKAWVKDIYECFNIFGGIFKYINDSGVLRFITHLSQLEQNENFQIFDIEVDYSLPTDLTKNIESKFTTSYLNQNYPFHLKNYKEAKFDFSIQNEYNTSMANLPIANYAETINYVQFTVNLIDRHFYSITFEPNEIGARPAAYTVEIDAVPVASGNITESAGNLSTIRFMSNKTGNVTVKITVTGKIVTANLSAADILLYDSTYDHTVTFNTLVLSEEGTLNVDPIDSYTTAEVEVPIDLGTRTGNWTFGESNFGNVIVAIKTVKLAGRGYNIKTSVIEDSKSKWTLESLGITYKMKKARSR